MKEKPEWQLKKVAKRKQGINAFERGIMVNISANVDNKIDHPQWKKSPVIISNIDKTKNNNRKK